MPSDISIKSFCDKVKSAGITSLAVIGSSEVRDTHFIRSTLEKIVSMCPSVTELVTGDNKGSDAVTVVVALENRLSAEVLPNKKTPEEGVADIVARSGAVVCFVDVKSKGAEIAVRESKKSDPPKPFFMSKIVL